MSVISPTTPAELKINSKFCGGKYIQPEFLSKLIQKPPNEKGFRDYISSVFFNDIDQEKN